jgi:hypothetical protein
MVARYLVTQHPLWQTLEETAALFDGDQAVEQVIAHGMEASEKMEQDSQDEKV